MALVLEVKEEETTLVVLGRTGTGSGPLKTAFHHLWAWTLPLAPLNQSELTAKTTIFAPLETECSYYGCHHTCLQGYRAVSASCALGLGWECMTDKAELSYLCLNCSGVGERRAQHRTLLCSFQKVINAPNTNRGLQWWADKNINATERNISNSSIF